MKTPEEIKKLCGWSLHENPEPGDSRNRDFFEADVQKVMQLLNAERTHPAPELREALRNMLEHYEYIPCDSYYAEDTKKVNNEAKAALSLPGLEAVECETCISESDYVKRHCPQRCDKGRVLVRKEKV